MTNPPPNDSAPTLNATQATEARTPPLSRAGNSGFKNNGAMTGTAEGRHDQRRQASSTTPHPSSTNTSQGPIVAAAAPPASK